MEFVRALCHVAQEELKPIAAPRVYSLTKIIEISHFNMSRIRCSPQPYCLCKQGSTPLKGHTRTCFPQSDRCVSSRSDDPWNQCID